MYSLDIEMAQKLPIAVSSDKTANAIISYYKELCGKCSDNSQVSLTLAAIGT